MPIGCDYAVESSSPRRETFEQPSFRRKPESRGGGPAWIASIWVPYVALLRELRKGLRRWESSPLLRLGRVGFESRPVVTGRQSLLVKQPMPIGCDCAVKSSFPRRETFEQPSFRRKPESRGGGPAWIASIWVPYVALLRELRKGLRRWESSPLLRLGRGEFETRPVVTGRQSPLVKQPMPIGCDCAAKSSFPRRETFEQPSFRRKPESRGGGPAWIASIRVPYLLRELRKGLRRLESSPLLRLGMGEFETRPVVIGRQSPLALTSRLPD